MLTVWVVVSRSKSSYDTGTLGLPAVAGPRECHSVAPGDVSGMWDIARTTDCD